MNQDNFCFLYNGEAVGIHEIPLRPIAAFREEVLEKTASGARLVSFFATPTAGAEAVRLYAVLGDPDDGGFYVAAADVTESYPALTPECTQAHLFEREIAEQWGIRPEGHPWLKPVRFHAPYRPAPGKGKKADILPGVTDHYQISGEAVHEVAVGPVHAGIIEPGHFRFQCHGEIVMHLEISLGYQHRGIERSLVGGPDRRTLPMMETLAGDTTIGHSLAYCQGIEALTGARAPFRAEEIRGIALELERLANHAGDLGALSGDVAYLPTASFCGRLRGDFLNMTALLCGNRFGRGWIRPGGSFWDMDAKRADELIQRLDTTYRELTNAVDLLWNTPSVMARFEDTGRIDRDLGEALGLVGVAARACGIRRDVRFEYPSGIFRFVNIPSTTWHSGDVFARAQVRWGEIGHSVAFIRERVKALSDGPVFTDGAGALRPNAFAVSMVEGWRGEICHALLTDEQGRFARYKVVDSSFHNWMGLAMALRGQQVSDFPLCNKSFNLSYCGFDL